MKRHSLSVLALLDEALAIREAQRVVPQPLLSVGLALLPFSQVATR